MKGVLILTEGRSGSEWLGSLLNGTGLLGNSAEWFGKYGLGRGVPLKPGAQAVTEILERSSTPNGYFAIKLFPKHLHRFAHTHGFDPVRHLARHHDVLCVRLTRDDRIRQAVSYARGLQTEQWTVQHKTKQQPDYDFEAICRSYFLIDRSNGFWDCYTRLYGLRCLNFTYESLLPDPKPFIDAVAQHAGVTISGVPQTRHAIQRDATSEEWAERFRRELGEREIIPFTSPSRPYRRTAGNLVRFLMRRQMTPFPYAY